MASTLNPEKKEVILSQIVEDLKAGLTKWKKDDIGFGSLEKKYTLTNDECIALFSHPKIKNVETRIPTFIIVDDLPDPVVEEETTKIEVAAAIYVAPAHRVETRKPVALSKPFI